MASPLARAIERTQVPKDAIALWWLAQAGFVFKNDRGSVFYLDPYLSNVVEKAFGFKRLSLAPIAAAEVRADWVVSSHEHLDHLDIEALPVIARNNPECRFIGPDSCQPDYAKCGLDASKTVCMSAHAQYDLGGVTMYTVRADHGDLSPLALSLLLDFGAVRVLFTGDTAYRPNWLQPLIDRKPDVLLPCINGKFGNLDALQAAQLTEITHPRIVIPCHFWMFMEHGGDPERFMQHCAELCPRVMAKLLSPGEGIVVSPSGIETSVLNSEG